MLRLETREFQDLTRWRWVLTDAAGAFIADHEVRLDPADWQFEAFADLPFYLRWHATLDRRAADEARIVGEVGEWIGARVLGVIGPELLRRRPAVVRVVVTAGAEDLLLRPLELAHVNTQPLAVQDVTLVMSAATDGAVSPEGERLRVLGLFSLPEGKRALNLRRERQELVRLIESIAATGKAANVRVLQYGVTRDALRDVLAEGEGWDIIHISGHGRPGELLLEEADGSLDPVDGPALAELLDLGRGRIKLVTVSACWSAAVAAGEQRRLLGLPTPEPGNARAAAEAIAGAGTVSGTLASLLAARLGCAVLAMRYPVGDEFAMALTGRLYELLADKGQPLARAVGMTLHELDSDSATSGAAAQRAFPALSMATPALFGDAAADLRLVAPARLGAANYDTGMLKMAGFPAQAARFVGRTGVMARASAALAARSRVPGVLLHGMPGGGKTACAVELAYGHEHAFDRLVWYKAPDEGTAIDGSLTDFALTLERYLPGFQMAHELVTSDRLAAFLPQLTELLERRRVLIVIDNAESLLTDSGHWRDDNWGQVLAALTAHTGLGRVVLTSRRTPMTGVTGLRAEPVDALSVNEALLLIRELPHLQALSRGKVVGLDPFASRQLARRAIELVQGHPKLLELAEGQAANPERLAALLKAGDQAWQKQGGLPDGFFSDGVSTASGDDYLQVLAAWTKSVTDTLTPGERDLFWLLCCLEEGDRERHVTRSIWPHLRKQLGADSEQPTAEQALTSLMATGLVVPSGEKESYVIHPGVASAGRSQAGSPFQDLVDTEAADYWAAAQHSASETANAPVNTAQMVRAGLAAIPYLIRKRRWEQAHYLLERAFAGNPSRANAATVLPMVEQIRKYDPRAIGVLARVLRVIAPDAAEAPLRVALDTAINDGDYRSAWVIAGRLADLYHDSGRLAEAQALARQAPSLTSQAGLGPWTQLADEGRVLKILVARGQAGQVLADVRRLRDRMDALPPVPGPGEAVSPWNVRETLLGIGRHAAMLLRQWDTALDLNATIIASKRDRRAPAVDIAQARFDDYGPLLSLGRTNEALNMLLECRQLLEDARDVQGLGRILVALADVEDRRGHGDSSIRLLQDALRYLHLSGDVANIAVAYHNLGSNLHVHVHEYAQALACHLAAALIRTLTRIGSNDAYSTQVLAEVAAMDVRALGAEVGLPQCLADLCRQLDDIPGTDLPGLIAKLSPDPEIAEAMLRDLIAWATTMASEP